MDDIGEQLKQQARWQKNRKALSWPEKVRQADAIRDAIKALRNTKTDSLQADDTLGPKVLTPAGTKD